MTENQNNTPQDPDDAPPPPPQAPAYGQGGYGQDETAAFPPRSESGDTTELRPEGQYGAGQANDAQGGQGGYGAGAYGSGGYGAGQYGGGQYGGGQYGSGADGGGAYGGGAAGGGGYGPGGGNGPDDPKPQGGSLAWVWWVIGALLVLVIAGLIYMFVWGPWSNSSDETPSESKQQSEPAESSDDDPFGDSTDDDDPFGESSDDDDPFGESSDDDDPFDSSEPEDSESSSSDSTPSRSTSERPETLRELGDYCNDRAGKETWKLEGKKLTYDGPRNVSSIEGGLMCAPIHGHLSRSSEYNELSSKAHTQDDAKGSFEYKGGSLRDEIPRKVTYELKGDHGKVVIEDR